MPRPLNAPRPSPRPLWCGVATFVVLATIAWSPAFAQAPPAHEPRVELFAATDLDTVFSAVSTRALLLRRTGGAMVRAVRSGLVLLDVRVVGRPSSLYVKFGADGMPRLRWQTRF